MATSHYRDWPLRELLRLGWEPFSSDANGIIMLRKQSETVPHERAELYAMVPGSW